MEPDLDNILPLLSRTPAALDALLRGLPSFWLSCNEGADTWTVFDVLGHLVYADRVNWMPRVRRILEAGDARSANPPVLEPFARDGHMQECAGKPLPELLDEFARLRAANLAELRSFSFAPTDLERRGLHPALGPVTLAQLLAAWAAHDLTHLHQTSRVLAFQYREAVGPWQRFLGVLHCDGHSLPA
jgi:hypothetical protein